MNKLLVALQEYHFVRVQLIGCMDREERQRLKQRRTQLERTIEELRGQEHRWP